MKNEVGVWQAEDATVFKLRETGSYHTDRERRGQPMLSNEYHLRVTFCSGEKGISFADGKAREEALAKRIVDLLNADDLRLAQEKKVAEIPDVRLFFLIFSKSSKKFYNDRANSWHTNPDNATWYTDGFDAHSQAHKLIQADLSEQLSVLRSDQPEISAGQYGM